ncbi:recombination mediator protein UvsY [bacterium]|jgi:hypothetical protein|nr:recombination mediator protein UvsY [bacterium]|tara:strand:- start:440 stop:883 length:444 start_codon:yes stop_codon:yes gene_type:complete
MNLKEIQAMWKTDCPIDDIELDASSLEVPKLHAKYAELLSNTKLSVIRYERQMKEMDKDKWLWYSGKLTKDQIEDKSWDYDPFGGLTVLKSDYDKFKGADKDIQDLYEKLQYLKITVEFLQDVVSQITWRHQTIKNIIEWRKFMAGS